jgi:serine/threonine protein kinase/tetratricopeptide (TPR) repeat protein
MTSEKPNRDEVFIAAIEIPSAPDRAEYIARACGDDAELRREVEKLVAGHFEAGSFLDQPAASPATGLYGDAAKDADSTRGREGPGTRIGQYKLLQQIGEGGMGVVYMADQQQPVRRRVALKIVKPGMDSGQVIARFEAERQALALMDHVNIARVLDADTTENGRPYFVMELVHGVPITKYCDDNHLTPRERLELFAPVCHAIQHAHQKGIIHRDVKPSNVLVTLYDGRPVPKVIDFGVAKAIDQELTERTLFTQFGTVVGTLEYMSPEQAGLSALGVDTRSDIYSLGVLLYELLTGTTPLERKRLRQAAFAEVMRLIQEEEPPKPSTRLSSSETLASVAAARKTEPAKLTRLVRGELDWIVMKCLEKDRTRRYETANALAREIQRYLADEPVEACPPSTGYRLRKFASKHRRLLVTVAAFVTLLLAAVAVSALLAVKALLAEAEASRQKKATEEALKAEAEQHRQANVARDTATSAKNTAEEEKAFALSVADFLRNDLLALANPTSFLAERVTPDRDLKLREVLDRANKGLGGRFVKQPKVEAELRMTIGLAYLELGVFEKAGPQLEAALNIRRLVLGADHLETWRSQLALGMLYHQEGKYTQAVALLSQLLARQCAILGNNHTETQWARTGLAAVYQAQKQYSKAEPLLLQNIEIKRAAEVKPENFSIGAEQNLAVMYQEQGKYDEAEKLFQKVLTEARKVLGNDHPLTLLVRYNLALLSVGQGQLDQAESKLRSVLAAQERKLGPDHPETLRATSQLGYILKSQGRMLDAESLYVTALEGQRHKLGEDHPATLATRHNLAVVYRTQSRLAEAEALYLDCLKGRRRRLGENHPDTVATKNNLAYVYLLQGRNDEAESLFRQVLQARHEGWGETGDEALTTRESLAMVYCQRGKYEDGEALYSKTLADCVQARGEDSSRAREMKRYLQLMGKVKPAAERYWKALAAKGPKAEETLKARWEWAMSLRDAQLFAPAAEQVAALLQNRLEVLGDMHPSTLEVWRQLAKLRFWQGRSHETATEFAKLVKTASAALGKKDPRTRQYAIDALELCRFLGRFDAELFQAGRQVLGSSSTEVLDALAMVGRKMVKRGKYTEAEPLLQEVVRARQEKQAGDWKTFNERVLLGASLMGQKKYAQAEPLMVAGYEAMKAHAARTPGHDTPRSPLHRSLTDAVEWLVRLYEEWGKPEQAAKWRARLEKN